MRAQSMGAHCWDLEPSLIQLPAMMRKGSQAVRRAGQAHNTVINGARAKEMGHTDREQWNTEEKEGREERRDKKERLQGAKGKKREKREKDVTDDLWRNKRRRREV